MMRPLIFLSPMGLWKAASQIIHQGGDGKIASQERGLAMRKDGLKLIVGISQQSVPKPVVLIKSSTQAHSFYWLNSASLLRITKPRGKPLF